METPDSMFDLQMPYSKKNKIITKKEAYLKACNYCAYQERLQDEVRQKLKEFWLDAEEVEDIISDLITNNFLNEERFAKAYAGGKFRIKQWGKLKIIRHLEMKRVSAYCIKKGMAEIEDADYLKTLNAIIASKKEKFSAEIDFVKKNKVATYAIGKGYEPELVWELLGKK